MPPRDNISMQMVREALLQSGLPLATRAALLTQAGIDPASLDQGSTRVPVRAYARLWRLLAVHLDDEFFAMDPRPLRSGSLAFICRTCIAQPSVQRGIESMLEFLGLMLTRFNARLTRHDRLVEITLLPETAPPLRAFAYFTFWIIVHGVICWLAGRRVPLLGMQLRSPAPAYCDDYRVMFGEPLSFAQPNTRIIFSVDCLDLPVRRSEAQLQRFLARAPANILVKYRDPDSFAQAIKAQLRGLAPAQWPDSTSLARQWCMSPATLRRRLAEQQQSYQRLKDGVRRDLAVAALAEPLMTLGDIAERLGFADTGSFLKAFRKWTGSSPGEYRRLLQHRGGQTAHAD